MKEAWLEMTLSQVCRFINGRAYKKDELLSEGKYRVLRVGNFFTNDHWYYSNLELEDDKYCDNGDLLYAWSASFGPRIWEEEKVIYHYHIWKLEPKENLVTKEYLFHLLEWDKEKIKIAHGTGTTMMHVSKGSMEQRVVPIPPLQEQQQIVSILDEAFAAIDQAKANIQKNIANAKELFQSKLNAIFSQKGEGWEEKKLNELCVKSSNIKWSEHKNKSYQYIDLSSVSRDTLRVEETQEVNSENAPSRAKQIVHTGDVIFATTRPTLKRATIITEELNNQICSTGFVVLRPRELEWSSWIFYYLQSSFFMDRMETVQKGASYPAVTDKEVKDSIIMIPKDNIELLESINTLNKLQEQISAIVDSYYFKLTSIEELRKSILQKAFAGELKLEKVNVA